MWKIAIYFVISSTDSDWDFVVVCFVLACTISSLYKCDSSVDLEIWWALWPVGLLFFSRFCFDLIQIWLIVASSENCWHMFPSFLGKCLPAEVFPFIFFVIKDYYRYSSKTIWQIFLKSRMWTHIAMKICIKLMILTANHVCLSYAPFWYFLLCWYRIFMSWCFDFIPIWCIDTGEENRWQIFFSFFFPEVVPALLCPYVVSKNRVCCCVFS